MQIKHEVTETVTKTKFVGTRCDRCGKETTDTSSEQINWGEGFGQNITSTLVRLQGQAYPEGGYSNGYEVHLCNECWDELIYPVVREFAKVVEFDW